MESSSLNPKSNKSQKPKNEPLIKFIPHQSLGLYSLRPGPGMDGTLNWLKSIRLHKYWPFFSHLNYLTMVSLKEVDLDWLIESLDAEPLHTGTKKKILQEIGRLQQRSFMLRTLDTSDLTTSWETINHILSSTPLANLPEFDGSFLLPLIKQKLEELKNVAKEREDWENIRDLLKLYSNHYIVSKEDRLSAELWINELEQNHVRKHYIRPNIQSVLSWENQILDDYEKLQMTLNLYSSRREV